MSIDNYRWYENVFTTARSADAVTPNDGVDLVNIPKALYVGVGGNIQLQPVGTNNPVTFENIPSGSYLLIQPRRVYSTSTTASGIIALF